MKNAVILATAGAGVVGAVIIARQTRIALNGKFDFFTPEFTASFGEHETVRVIRSAEWTMKELSVGFIGTARSNKETEADYTLSVEVNGVELRTTMPVTVLLGLTETPVPPTRLTIFNTDPIGKVVAIARLGNTKIRSITPITIEEGIKEDV